MKRSLRMLPLLLAGIAFSACSSNRVKVYLTDAPLDGATAVNITVTGIEVKGSGSVSLVDGGEGEDVDGPGRLVFAEPRTFNLLELRNGVRTYLGEVEVDGDITQLRLLMDGSATVVYEDGSERVARVPSGENTGVKLVGGIPADVGEVTLDFDAAKSIHETGNGELVMRPTIKVVTGDFVELDGGDDDTGDDTDDETPDAGGITIE